jgi:hypothetical protein
VKFFGFAAQDAFLKDAAALLGVVLEGLDDGLRIGVDQLDPSSA